MSGNGSAEIRFIAKRLGTGRQAVWAVYDRQRGSYPTCTPELGAVAQDHPDEAAAQVECDRLAAAYGSVDQREKRRASRSATPQLAGEGSEAESG